MKINIGQPKQEENLNQLKQDITYSSDVIFYYHYLNECQELAKKYHKLIITGYKDENNKDKALIIECDGTILLDRK